MSPLTLTVRDASSELIDLAGLTPDALAGLDRNALAARSLADGRRVDAVFDIAYGDPACMVIRPNGVALMHAGAGMRAGKLTIEGDAGDFAGRSMRGGTLVVNGNAGDFIGSGLPGDRQGMRGGTIVVLGNAGDRAGERMRRGLIVVAGSAGAYAGANMLAGTIVVAGTVGTMPGFGLKRGSLVLGQSPSHLPATFGDSGEHDLVFLTLLEKQLRREDALAGFPRLDRRARRYCGDLACGGTGEILVLS